MIGFFGLRWTIYTVRDVTDIYMLSSLQIANFVAPVLVSKASLEGISSSKRIEAEEVLHILEFDLGLFSVPSLDTSGVKNHFLSLCDHDVYGKVLVMPRSGLVYGHIYDLMLLETGEKLTVENFDVAGVVSVKYLFEPFKIEHLEDRKQCVKYVQKQSGGLLRLSMTYQWISAFAASSLFIANYTILLFFLPTRNLEAYFQVAILLAFVALLYVILTYLQKASEAIATSYINERLEILKYIVLWSLSPTFVRKHGLNFVLLQVDQLTSAIRAELELRKLVIPIVALLPILILLYVRVPSSLFWIVLCFSILGAIPSYLMQLKSKNLIPLLYGRRQKNTQELNWMISNISKSRHYNTLDIHVSKWKKSLEVEGAVTWYLGRRKSFADGASALFSGLSYIVTFIALAVIIRLSQGEGNELTVGYAFIIFYLVAQLNSFVPRLIILITTLTEANHRWQGITPILNEAQNIKKLAEPTVQSGNPSVEFNKLRLPYGCRFEEGDKLTQRFDGAQLIQIAGNSGAGKSTFLRCLLGIVRPRSGSVLVHDADPVSFSQDERRRIFSYIDQNTQLLPGTIRDNLSVYSSIGNSDRSLWEILERVQLQDMVKSLPMELDTLVSDGGTNFSTGERQRIALAQCLAKGSSVLVLDEAMSGLTEQMEGEIFRNIIPLFGQVYFVSHIEQMGKISDAVIRLRDRT